MPTIMPLSDLRNCNIVFERLNAELKLVSALVEGEASAARDGWVPSRDAKRRFGVR